MNKNFHRSWMYSFEVQNDECERLFSEEYQNNEKGSGESVNHLRVGYQSFQNHERPHSANPTITRSQSVNVFVHISDSPSSDFRKSNDESERSDKQSHTTRRPLQDNGRLLSAHSSKSGSNDDSLSYSDHSLRPQLRNSRSMLETRILVNENNPIEYGKRLHSESDLSRYQQACPKGKRQHHRVYKQAVIGRRAMGHFGLKYSPYDNVCRDQYADNEKYGVFHEAQASSHGDPSAFSTSEQSLKEVLDDSLSMDITGSPNISDQKFILTRLSRREKYIIFLNCMTFFLCHVSITVMAPFFPTEIESRDISHAVSGWIFAVYPLTQVIASPIVGFILPSVGCTFLMLSGGFLVGSCTLLFGFLSMFPQEDQNMPFIVLAFALKIFSGIGTTAQLTAAFTLCVMEFPDNISTVFSIGEIFVGLGMMLGPVIGGFLYEAGGFLIPFATVGGLILINLPLNLLILRNISQSGYSTGASSSQSSSSDPTTTMNTQKYTLKEGVIVRKFIFHPLCLVNSLAITTVGILFAVLDPTLAPHLTQFNLNADEIGLVFLLMAVCYSISCPVFGILAYKLPDKRYLMVIGFALATCGFLLIGPSPFTGISTNDDQLWMNLVAIIILGVAASMAIVSTFDIYVQVADKLGIEVNVVTFSVLSGIYDSFYAVGDFIGPAAGGWLTSMYGFEWCSTVCAGVCVLACLTIVMNWCCENLSTKDRDTKFCCRCVRRDREVNIYEKKKLLRSSVETPLIQDLLQDGGYDIHAAVS